MPVGDSKMKIALSGSSGLIGSALISFLEQKNCKVMPLIRKPMNRGGSGILWDPYSEAFGNGMEDLEGLDGVVHLSGENIAGIWTGKKKQNIYDSRIKPTNFLSRTLASLKKPPGVFVCASAIGIYGDQGDEMLTEAGKQGIGFLPEVVRDWEKATEPAVRAGIRVVNLRFGIILSTKGGALPGILLPFKMGLGGVLGSGRQFWSWITITDVLHVIHESLTNRSISGPVNVVAPEAVRNQEFTKTLGSVLSRPVLLPVPAFALRFALGDMADALLLASARVIPEKLQRIGYSFHHPDLNDALERLFKEKL